jgi:hypothetical protein
VPLPGDTDGDGKVLTNDYATFRKNFEQSVSCRDTAPWRRGDFNADNKIDMADFALLSANFGKTNGPVLPVVDTPDCRIRFATGSCNRSNSAPEISNAALYTLNAGQYSQSPAAEVLKLKRDGTQRYIIPHATIIDRDGDLPSFTLSLYNGSGMPVTLSNQTDYRAYTGKNADGSRYWYAVVRADESYNTGLLTLTVADPYTSKVQYYRWQFVN